MGILDRLFGSTPAPNAPRGTPQPASGDDQAIARYRYLLRTAPPEAIEQAHAEAFAQLTPEQRAEVLRQLSAELPPGERAGAGSPQPLDPQGLARVATRAELRQPGILERVLGPRSNGPGFAPGGGGIGLGGMMAGTLLSSIAGTFIGSAIAHQFLDGFDSSPEAGHDAHGLADAQDSQDTHDAHDANDANDANDAHADNSGDDIQHDDHDALASNNDDFSPDTDYSGDNDFGGDDFDV